MGNDHSHLSGIEIEEKSIELSDFWSQHSATVINSGNITHLSVFIAELFINGPLWVNQTPLEKNTKNLMIYRHPCIIKYISSWQQSTKFYLAVEEVTPLAKLLAAQSTLQICIGLHAILKALCFLHDTANVSHNNVCIASIFLTRGGNYKLGGMDYLCAFDELTSDYLSRSKLSRYGKAIDPNEEKNVAKGALLDSAGGNRKDSIDVYAFGVLVCEMLKSRDEDDIPSLGIFRDLCKNSLQNVNVNLRPKLCDLLQHGFFKHDFIAIHSFLVELPLKTDEEKAEFFVTLPERLRLFNEATVAEQLVGLLLSRMVFLDKTAQNTLLPVILSPRQDPENTEQGLFSEATFKKYLIPKLLEIFPVRDAQIRVLLLNHFGHFMHTFTKDQLQTCILPELLLGIKDTNDQLVSVTLRTLADLVPLLGAAAVIGGKRAKLFNDGRPTIGFRKSSTKSHQNAVATPSLSTNDLIGESAAGLPERPRPDGEEGETSTDEVEIEATATTSGVIDEDIDNWEEWSINEPSRHVINEPDEHVIVAATTTTTIPSSQESVCVHNKKAALPDISELDIKNQVGSFVGRNNTSEHEVDFFEDMVPVIERAAKYLVRDDRESMDDATSSISNKLNLLHQGDGGGGEDEDGWIDEDWE